jgi:PKD repeat protein
VACADVSEILEPTPAFVDSSSFHTVVFTNLTTDADQNTTYLWDFGDGTTSTDFAPIHVYPYGEECENFATVTLTVSNDCGSWQFVNDSVAYGACVSVEEVSGVVAVDVFPNPSTGNFTIVSAEGGKTQIQVLDLNGKIIYAETSVITSGMGHQVDVSNVSHGVYILKVMVNQKQSITRLILE